MDFHDAPSSGMADAIEMDRSLPRERLVVIGNGMAGCRAVEELLARDAERYRVTIFGAEPHVNYNRIMLSPVLAGEKTFDEIVINGPDWYADNGIELIAGDPIVAIDRSAKTVTSRAGRTIGYDKLLIATGSDPFVIPVPGHDLPGVISFRDMADVDAMLTAAANGGEAVVIGDRRKFLSALVTLDEAAVKTFLGARLEGVPMHQHAEITAAVQNQIDEVNEKLARVEQVKKFTILPRQLGIDTGELTPTLKVKRKAVNQNFSREIEAMYVE